MTNPQIDRMIDLSRTCPMTHRQVGMLYTGLMDGGWNVLNIDAELLPTIRSYSIAGLSINEMVNYLT